MRKSQVTLLCAALFCTPIPTGGQERTRVPHIGFLNPGAVSYAASNIAAFREGLLEMGYTEGKNILVEYRHGEDKKQRFFERALDFVNPKVDIIIVASTPAIRAVKETTKTIPIVMAAAAAPVETRLVENLTHPGGNLTGLNMRFPDIGGIRLALIKEIVSKSRWVNLFWNPSNESHLTTLKLKENEAAEDYWILSRT